MKCPALLLVWEEDQDPFLDITGDSTLTALFLTQTEGALLYNFFREPDPWFENQKICQAETLQIWIERDDDQKSGFNMIIDHHNTRVFCFNVSIQFLKNVANDCRSSCLANGFDLDAKLQTIS